jgi:CRISPR/Cas system CMR subunit Cmr4 (Cas7 group RAMP superfamily)
MSDSKRDARPLTARWTITARLTIKSAAQIGSHEAEVSGQTFERDHRTGRPILRGTTMAGALRSALNDNRSGYRRKDDSPDARRLFGYLSENDKIGSQSAVIVYDAVAAKAGAQTAQAGTAVAAIRDGVALDPRNGLVDPERGMKYDREVSLPGVEFPLRFDLLVPDDAMEPFLVRGLVDALNALADGEISFGARKSRGLGACIADDFRAVRYDLTDPEVWWRLAQSNEDWHPDRKTEEKGHECPQNAIDEEWGRAKRNVASLPEPKKSKTRSLRLTLNLTIPHTLLIRSPGQTGDSADDTHLTENGVPLLSGTSLAGALRSHTLRILNALSDTPPSSDAEFASKAALDLWNDLWGRWPSNGYREGRPTGSRVYVPDAPIARFTRYRQTRVKIDRFTGGAIDKALFEEEPCVGGTASLTIQVRLPYTEDGDTTLHKAEIGLMLLAARDLCDGFVPVGGGAAVGRGVLHGTVTANLPDSDENFEFGGGSALATEKRDYLNSEYLQPLREYLNGGETRRSAVG